MNAEERASVRYCRKEILSNLKAPSTYNEISARATTLPYKQGDVFLKELFQYDRTAGQRLDDFYMDVLNSGGVAVTIPVIIEYEAENAFGVPLRKFYKCYSFS